MRYTRIVLVLAALLLAAAFAAAQAPPAGDPEGAAAEIATAATEAAASAAPAVALKPALSAPAAGPALADELPPIPSDGEALAQAAEAVRQLSGASTLNGAAKRKAIFGGLTAAFTFLIWLLRRYLAVFLNEQVVIATAALLFLVVLFTSHAAAGQPLWQSIDIALSGPAALAFHALSKLPRPSLWLKAADKAEKKVKERAARAALGV